MNFFDVFSEYKHPMKTTFSMLAEVVKPQYNLTEIDCAEWTRLEGWQGDFNLTKYETLFERMKRIGYKQFTFKVLKYNKNTEIVKKVFNVF